MGRAGTLLPAAHVIRDSLPIRHRGATLRLPSDEHLLIHHAIHAQLNNSYWQAIRPGLREAYDCRLLLTRLAASGSLPGFLDRCRKDKRLAVIALHVRTIQELVDKPVPMPPSRMFSGSRVRWLHRRLLRAAPGLRFIDPYFFFRSSVMPRLYRLKDLGKSWNGLRYAVQTPFRRSFYRNLFKELF